MKANHEFHDTWQGKKILIFYVHRYMSNVSKNIDGESIRFQVSKRIRIKKRKKFAKRIEFSEF